MQQRKKTRIKSFRLDESIIERLGRAAKRAHATESGFLSDLLEYRLSLDPLIPAFQEIALSTVTFQSILSATEEDALETAASEVARRNMPLVYELYESSGQTLNFQEFVTGVLGTHGRWFYVEGNINLTHGWVTLRHGYGHKWSRFLRGYLLSTHDTFSKEKLNIRIGDQFVRISFKTNHQESDSHGKDSHANRGYQ